jgi:hypothetical protein
MNPSDHRYQPPAPPPTPPPLPRRPGSFDFRQFIWGIVVGTALSAVVWIVGWKAMEKMDNIFLLLVLPIAKLIAATWLMFVPPWRAFGVGIYVSLALGFLIFFGRCFAAILTAH